MFKNKWFNLLAFMGIIFMVIDFGKALFFSGSLGTFTCVGVFLLLLLDAVKMGCDTLLAFTEKNEGN